MQRHKRNTVQPYDLCESGHGTDCGEKGVGMVSVSKQPSTLSGAEPLAYVIQYSVGHRAIGMCHSILLMD